MIEIRISVKYKGLSLVYFLLFIDTLAYFV